MPTDEQLKEYAARLPDIYRDILAAFPGVVPSRKVGWGLTAESILDYLDDTGPGYDDDEVRDALAQLEDAGFFVRQPPLGSYTPTDLGDRLITAVTGRSPQPKGAPPLPQPTWG